MKKEIQKLIINAGIKAPSGDNVQPIKFYFDKYLNFLDLNIIKNYDNSIYNKDQLASYIALGASIENINTAAIHYGYETEIEIFQENNKKGARIWFYPNCDDLESTVVDKFKAIDKRYTNRFKFAYVNIDTDIFKDLLQIDTFANLILIKDKSIIKDLAKILKINDSFVFKDRLIHRHFFSLLRWSKREAESKKDGMHINTLGLSTFEKLFFPLLKYWNCSILANIFGLSHLVDNKQEQNLLSSTMLGFITVSNFDKFGAVETGRLLERIWLEATIQELAFQPIIGLPLLINQGTLTNTKNKLKSILNINSKECIAVGFRIGKATITPPKTLRKLIVNT